MKMLNTLRYTALFEDNLKNRRYLLTLRVNHPQTHHYPHFEEWE